MKIKIQQKFFTVFGDKFAITDENNQPVFYAKEEFLRFRANAHLYNVQGLELCCIVSKLFSLLGCFYIYDNDVDKQSLGLMKGKFYPVPFVRKWTLEFNGQRFVYKCGPFNCKIFSADENFKFDKTAQIGHVHKQLLRIRDTYEIDFDETKITSECAALIGLWMDKTFHKDQN